MPQRYKLIEDDQITNIAVFEDDALAEELGYVPADEGDEIALPPADAPTDEDIRTIRDELLSATDYTQLPDVTDSMLAGTKTDWAGYRQALRDVPANLDADGFPVWPAEPTDR